MGEPQVTTGATELAIRSDSIGPILPLATPEAMTEAMRAYGALKAAVLTENDEQEITVRGKKRKFVKRSGWRRLSIAFGVSTTILDRKIMVGPEGRTLTAEFTVRATAPNGRFADGWGACSAWEERFQDERGRGKMEHDIPATAETRAENRAASNLFGYGEMSAEEMEDSPGVARPTCPKCGKPVKESTFTQGEWYCWAKQGGCGWKGTAPILADTGEIPTAKASAASVDALKGAQGGGSASPSSGPTPTAVEGDVAAERPVPGRSVGPRAKRSNVVAAPQATPIGQGEARGMEGTPPQAASPASAAVQGLTEGLDDGKEQFLATLRQQAREAAAVLRQLRVRLENRNNKEAIALGSAQAVPLPQATPSTDSDESLVAYIASAYPGKALATLNEAELNTMLDKFEELTKRVEARLK